MVLIEDQRNLNENLQFVNGSKMRILWHFVLLLTVLHAMALYGLYLAIVHPNWKTLMWAFIYGQIGTQAVLIGSHRFYGHKSFKARFIVRLFLNLFQIIAGQNSMYTWARVHRVHHKYSDTDADPHNSTRGFFFSHIGWTMMSQHPDFSAALRKINLTDLKADSLIQFQKKYFLPLYAVIGIGIPVAVPVYLWNETLVNAFFIAYSLRYMVTLHEVLFINSVAHMYGTKPFDKNIQPVETAFVSIITGGEGWHNYHHTFPMDYRASELGAKYNLSATIIDLLAYLGLAYDLRTAPEYMIKHRSMKYGDGSHPKWGHIATTKME